MTVDEGNKKEWREGRRGEWEGMGGEDGTMREAQ